MMRLIGFVAYQYERRTKALSSRWIACPVESAQRIEIPAQARRIEIDPHLPQGAVRYDLRIVNAQGLALTSRKDFLDMSKQRRTLALELPAASAALEATCSLMTPIAGLASWPVEIRFFH